MIKNRNQVVFSVFSIIFFLVTLALNGDDSFSEVNIFFSVIEAVATILVSVAVFLLWSSFSTRVFAGAFLAFLIFGPLLVFCSTVLGWGEGWGEIRVLWWQWPLAKFLSVLVAPGVAHQVFNRFTRTSSRLAIYGSQFVLAFILSIPFIQLISSGYYWFGAPYGVTLSLLIVANMLLFAGAFGIGREVRHANLVKSSLRLSQTTFGLDLRVKKFFSAKLKASVLSFLAVTGAVATFAIFSISLDLTTWAAKLLVFCMVLLVAAYATLTFAWIPTLVANRALEKGKSWNAFFWLSLLISPILMWIIAEASSTTAKAGPGATFPVEPGATGGTEDSVPSSMDTRLCPMCAEEIKIAAKLCKHCGSTVEPVEV